MEAVEAGSRQSGLHSLINRERFYSPTKNFERERDYTTTPNMATPTVISPTNMFPHNPYAHINSAPPSSHTLSGLISPPQSHPPESRRTSDDKDPNQPHRQSLPSIQEALADPKTSAYVPVPSTAISSHPYTPPTYSQHPPTPTNRSFSNNGGSYQPNGDHVQPRHTSPQPLHPSSYPRGDPTAQLPYEHPRQPSLPSIRTALPPSTHGPRPELARHEQDSRAPGSNGYTYQAPQYSGHPPATGSISSGYSPHSPYQSHQYAPRYGPEHGPKQHLKLDHEEQSTGYGPVLKRNLDYWDVEVDLRTIVECGKEVSRLSELLLAEQQRNLHHGSGPERMPTLHDCDLMLFQREKLAHALDRIKEHVQKQGDLEAERGKAPAEFDQEGIHQWDEDGKNPQYIGPDAKKRRGRAAPPGRCHSCNRAETPEWRRGPDGARTLCNACGLHYAKLTRKLGSKQAQSASSSLRPKSMDETSPR